MSKAGLLLSRPFILQLSRELSLLILLEVDNNPSCLDLIKWTIFLEKILVIHFPFLFIVKKSLDIAILAEIKGILNFLLIK